MFKKITLKNGLRVITVPQKESQAVTVLVLVGTGSKYETKDISGISHFLEHIFFKGTKKRPKQIIIAETLDKVGGIFNAFTSESVTGYFAKVEASKFALAFDWVADIFLNSLLPAKEIQKEKGVIVEEINMINDHPMKYVSNVWLKLLYGDQPMGWDIAGTKESVGAINRKKLMDYMKKQYVAESTILCVSGKINPPQVEKLAKRYFSKLTKGSPIQKIKVIDAPVKSVSMIQDGKKIEKQKKPNCLVEYKKTDQTHFCLGVRSYNIFHPQRYAQDVLGVILGGGMSSRLFVEVRDKLGLAYYIATEIESDSDVGFLLTRAGVDNQRVERAISTVLKEYKKLCQKKVSNAELKKAKDNIKGKMALLLEPSDVKAIFYGTEELLEGRIMTPKELFKKIDKVTVNDILKVANDIFRPEKLNLALIGPFKDKNKFQKLLKL